MRRRRERGDRESGITVIEFVLFTPLLFLFMFGSVQLGLGLFARHVATSAAQEGARTARDDAINPDVNWETLSTADARQWVTELLGGLVVGTPNAVPEGAASIGGKYPKVGVQVTFDIVSVVPWWQFHYEVESTGPVECFYTPQETCYGP